MRNICVFFCLILALLTSDDGVLSARQGTITGLTLSPAAANTGAAVSATATGSTNPCGAVHIDWGDGTAITYPTATLPVTQSHVYKTAGTFTVRAQGMGNCAGEATARIVITAPPPAPATPRLTALALSASAVDPRSAVAITLEGSGACRVMLDFGDGNTQEVGGPLPATVRHTYALRGRYTLVASPVAPCTERRVATLDVGARGERQPQRISGIEIAQPPGGPPSERALTMLGSGRCSYTLDFGDGNSETRDGVLPDVVRHNYPAEGRYTVVATARPPCSGVQRSTFIIGRDLHGSISRVSVRPQVARVDAPVVVTIAGSGTCKVVVDFDDGESRTITDPLPYRITYRYARPGDYEIVAWTDQPCTGGGDAVLRVRN